MTKLLSWWALGDVLAEIMMDWVDMSPLIHFALILQHSSVRALAHPSSPFPTHCQQI